MATNQELQHQSARDITGTEGTYNSDFLAMFALAGYTTGTFNERFLLWLNDQLGAAYTSLNDAMNAFAIEQGAMNWHSMGTFTIGPGGAADAFLLEDDSSGILLEDGSSYLLMEAA
jgi:hypothetical protein